MKIHLFILGALFAMYQSAAAGLPAIPVTDEWKARIQEIAPAKPTVPPTAGRKVLLYSTFTGFKHWVIPHTDEMLRIVANKSGACEIVTSTDINLFSAERLQEFDAVILNNNCSKNPGRHLFLDILGDQEKAEELENNLIDFVARGGGLMAVHGAIVIFNNSAAFSDLLGGSFDFHPKQQEVVLTPVDPAHPLVQAFDGKPFVHVDEPYLFKNAYIKKNFRPLLVMDTAKLEGANKKVHSDIRYVSWIKKHGKGRVFYVSPSHNAQSFDQPALLQFYLDGLQYVLGDLPCDDSPLPAGD